MRLREQLRWRAQTPQRDHRATRVDFAKTRAHVLNALERGELVALNSTLLHELYFASLGGDGQPTKRMIEVITRDFGSLDPAMDGRAVEIGTGGCVLCVRVPRRCKTAIKLREAGFDAKYMNSGHSAWKAIGAPLRVNTEAS